MAKQMIRDVAAGEPVAAPFRVDSLRLMPFKQKPGYYLDLRLGDASGELTARLWEQAKEAAAALAPGQIVGVEGRAEEYRGVLQVVINRLWPLEEGEYEPADFMRVSSRPQAEMLEELDATVAEVQDPWLQGLLRALFEDPELRERFARSPGAVRLHHACVGGLMEHTLSVARLCRAAAEQHPELSRDLLLAGALLHDLGKALEISGEWSFDHTDEGRFCGHVVLTDRLVMAAIGAIADFPVELRNLLTHMLLSHHGELQWGAPVKPHTAEALALHFADNLDAKVQTVADFKASPEAGTGPWSSYHRALETNIYLGPTSFRAEDAAEENSGD